MIALRKVHPAFRMTEKAAVDRALQFLPGLPGTTVAYILRGHANGDAWTDILVVYTGGTQAQTTAVPGMWTVVANQAKAGLQPLGIQTDTVRVAPASLLVAHRD
jgi:pullulanase